MLVDTCPRVGRLVALCVLLLPLLRAAATGEGVRAAASAAACPARVAVLGADMSAGGRFEVQRALKVGAHTLQLVETTVDEQAQGRNLVPRHLRGTVAVSSALLHPLPAGSGLSVSLNQAITLATAETYAEALLTAGIANAAAGVAAPTSQRALGTTALLGLLRAAAVACVPVSPRRRDLAIREVVLSDDLAQAVGRQAAPRLMLALTLDATSQRLSAPAALAALLRRDAAARGLALPSGLMPSLVAFLRDLVASGAYAHLRVTVDAPSPWLATVRMASSARLPVAIAHPSRRVAPVRTRAGVWRGVVTSVGTSALAARLRGGLRAFSLARSARIYRNGQPQRLDALRPGDAITVTTDATGLATALQAAGHDIAPTVAATARLADAPAVAALVALVLLLLLFFPLAVAVQRRRHGAVMAPAPLSVFTPRPVYVPKGLQRAPFKRKGHRFRP